MTSVMRAVAALSLLLACSPSARPVTDSGAGGAGATGGAGAGGADAATGGNMGGMGGLGGMGGAGGAGGAIQDAASSDAGGTGGAGGARPDASADGRSADTADGVRAADARPDALDAATPDAPAAPDAGIATDARPPDGGFRYPNPDGRLCGNARHTLAKTPAEVLVVLDRSSSMSTPTTAPRTRWDDARDAVNAVVMNSRNIGWGLKLFPTGTASCMASATVEVPVGFGHEAAIANAMTSAGPPGGRLGTSTPTELAIQAGAAYLTTVTSMMPKYMVLVTDGVPTCPPTPLDSPVDSTITALATAAASGFKTFVIGLGTASEADTLNRMADAGGKARPTAPRFYPAETRADLDAALQAITLSVTTCIFPLATRPLDPSYVSVTVGSTLVPRDLTHTEGWDYVPDGTAIEIHGSACHALKTGTALDAGIHFGCLN